MTNIIINLFRNNKKIVTSSVMDKRTMEKLLKSLKDSLNDLEKNVERRKEEIERVTKIVDLFTV